MILTRQFNKGGSAYWLADGAHLGRTVLAEGDTRKEALKAFSSICSSMNYNHPKLVLDWVASQIAKG